MELADVARLLHGGELVLSTGIALPDEPGPRWRAYVADLAAAEVSGLAVELGRRYDRLPVALVEAAQEHGVPLIAFRREVPFVEITETVHAMIIDAQLAELRASERLHETFTDLSVAGAPPEEIVRQAALLAGRPVILEDLAHRVLACSASGADPGRLLAGFEQQARAVCRDTAHLLRRADRLAGHHGGRPGRGLGRVILACDGPPTGPDTVLIERAASTLALGRLLTRQQESLERQAHRTLIGAIVESAHADPGEAEARARALGVPVSGRRLVAAIARLRDTGPGISAHARMAEVTEALADACREGRIPALVGSLDDVRAGVLLSLPLSADADEALAALSTRLRQRRRPAAPGRRGAGPAARPASGVRRGVRARRRPPTESLRDVRQAFLEARQVGDMAIGRPEGRPFYRLPDLRLRGLLHLSAATRGCGVRRAREREREVGRREHGHRPNRAADPADLRDAAPLGGRPRRRRSAAVPQHPGEQPQLPGWSGPSSPVSRDSPSAVSSSASGTNSPARASSASADRLQGPRCVPGHRARPLRKRRGCGLHGRGDPGAVVSGPAAGRPRSAG